MKKTRKSFFKLLPLSMAGFLVTTFCFGLFNNVVRVDVAKALPPPITINNVSLTLLTDVAGPGFGGANIGDTIRIDATITNMDHPADCTTASPVTTVDLTKYGGTATEALAVQTCNNGAADVWRLDFPVVNAGASGIDVAAANAASQVTVTATDNIDIGGATLASNSMAQLVDTSAPVVTVGCISVTGDTGTPAGTFKNGDFAITNWDNSAGCDNAGGTNNDVVSVSFAAGDFNSAALTLPGTAFAGVWTAWVPPLDPQDDTSNNITVEVTDDAGNVTTVTGTNDYVIDSILPAFSGVNPIVALTQAGAATSLPTYLWYYYDTPAPDFVKVKVSNVAEADANPLASVRMCIESMNTNVPAETCNTADFANPAKSVALTVNDGLSSTSSYDLAGLFAWPSLQTGYSMNFKLIDDAGNVTESGPFENFIGIFNVNPKFDLGMTELNNATTTDFSDITDFTNIVGLTFNANDGINDYGRLTFTDPVNLTDFATVTALAAFADNLTISNSVMRVDSSAIAALDLGAQLMMRTGTVAQPGLVVKNDAGAIIDYVPNDAGPLDSYVLSGGHGTVSNFVWNAGLQTLTYDVTGFSEYDSDSTAPTKVSSVPANGATSVSRTGTVSMTFSEAMDTASFAFTDSTGMVYAAPVWSNGNKTVTLTHAGSWANSVAVTITATTAKDASGNALSGSNNFSFTVVAAGGGGGGGGAGGSASPPCTSATCSTPNTTQQVTTQQTQTGTTQEGIPSDTTGTQQTSFFTDTTGHWAEQYINQLHEFGIDGYLGANGDPLHLFEPESNITRAELITILMKVKFGTLPAVSVSPYADVPTGHWAAQYITKAKEMGVVSGYGDGDFRPNANASRGEALKMILLTWVTPADIAAAAVNNSCTDVAQTDWFAQYFNYALNNAVVGGYEDADGNPTGFCGPSNNVTRAESAKITVVTKGL